MTIKDTIAVRDLEALRAALAGQVFVPGQAGYDQARQAWNLAVDERPGVVVAAGSAADAVTAVRYARAHGLRVAPQGTGHGAAPLEPLDGAMLLRTTRMRRVGMRLYPVRELYAGDLFFPVQRAAEVLHAWREWTAAVPDEVTSICHLLRLPPLPEVPEPLRGRRPPGVPSGWHAIHGDIEGPLERT